MISENHPILKDLEDLFRIEFIGSYEDETCIANLSGARPLSGYRIDESTKFTFNLKEFKESLEKLAIIKSIDDLVIYDTSHYEVVSLQENRRIPYPRKEILLNNSDLEYSFGRISFVFLLHLVSTIKTEIPSLFRFFRMPLDEEYLLADGSYNLNEILCETLRLSSLKIKNNKNLFNESNINKYETSFRFHLAYNLDITLIPQRFLEEIVGSNRIRRMRQTEIDQLDTPKKFYNDDLVNHYILAISSDNLVMQYLSYYHVIEHFFNKISEEEIINTVRNIMISEDFSYKKDKDIMKTIKKVKDFYKTRIDNNLTYNEADSLKLCLLKYINIQDDILEKLESYKPELIDFYKNETVFFSKGYKVNLRNTDRKEVIANLSTRIYWTRNSLVHSKDGDKERYAPFKHDKYLIKEIPLIRFIAESIITKESQII